MTTKFDAIVIGAGNAGQGGAGVLRAAGKRVMIVESRDVGGTCPLRGCVPKKVLVAAAETLDAIARADRQAIEVGAAHLDWGRLIARKESILAGTSESMEKDLAARGIELVRGAARFVAERAIDVGGIRYEADQFLVATGSRPRTLEFPGADLAETSDELLEWKARPERVVFIGGGVIAFEFAHVLARAGTKVTILELAPRPLGVLDAELVEHAVAASRDVGIDVHAGVKVEAIERAGDALRVRYRDGEGAHAIETDRVVNGAGRVANVDGLDVAAAGIELERGAVKIGSPFRSASRPHVFVAGDAIAGTPQLSPVATYEGRLAGRVMLGESVEGEYACIPSCVFTIPTAAWVGATEAALTERGVKFRATRNDQTGWRSGRSYAEKHAWAKVLIGEDDSILGVHLLGHGAGEVVNLFALAMRTGTKAKTLKEYVWAYPTFSSDAKFLL